MLKHRKSSHKKGKEKPIRMDVPLKHKSHVRVEYRWQDVWQSWPEVLMAVTAIYLLLSGKLHIAVALMAVTLAWMGIVGRIRRVRK